VNGIKVTETGLLGRNFVQAFWDSHLRVTNYDDVFRPTRELECPEATRIHFLLSEFKYVKKIKSKINLTEKGRRVLEKNLLEDLYSNQPLY
jgi:predicted methyltransferase